VPLSFSAGSYRTTFESADCFDAQPGSFGKGFLSNPGRQPMPSQQLAKHQISIVSA
jgi:hypothetical protein